jgi:DNA-binding NarL/FixJ family response regulator
MKAPKSPKTTGTRRGIFIVDDHPITRHGLIQLINHEPDLRVCGEAAGAQPALDQLASIQPALVLADITMPGKSGLDFIKDLQVLHPGLAVLVMSMHDESIYAERVLRAGGRGYIMKSEGGEKLLEAIRQVLGGQVYVSQCISADILDTFTHRTRPGSAAPGRLSDREFEVFQLIGQGLSTREIAQRLNLSVKTVGTHRLHIKEKLNLRSGPELIKQAVRWSATQQLV